MDNKQSFDKFEWKKREKGKMYLAKMYWLM